MPKKERKRSFEESAFVRVAKETGQHEELRRGLIQKLEAEFKAKIVTFFTSFRKREAQIVDTDAEMLESVLSSEPTDQKLMLVLSSPGGQGLAAERFVNVCRAYSNMKFEVIVPHMAKSAATMICFGAAAIHMSKTAELGPVDPQVPYWTGDEEQPDWISAEEYVRSYDNLMKAASDGKVKRLEPFLQQLSRYDARFMEKVRSAQRLSEDISVRLLGSLMMPGKRPATIKGGIDVFLTQKRTSSHGRMINHEEAKQCGLKVKLVDLHSTVWHYIWELYIRSDWCVNNRCVKLLETAHTSVSA